MANIELTVEDFTFDPRPSYPLLVTTKRYTHSDSHALSSDPSAITLVFAHATATIKECWEPTLKWIFAQGNDNRKIRIREAWSIECPNHGDAAILNEEELKVGYDQVFSWEAEYARVIYLLITGLGKGIPMDFSKHRLVGLGHSMGAISILLSRTYYPTIPFTSIILVDPMIIGPSFDSDARAVGALLPRSAEKRRDVWASREEALQSILKGKSTWNEEATRLFVQYGLTDLPTPLYPDRQGVTLKCTKWHEKASYQDSKSSRRAYGYLKYACEDIPIHIICGQIHDVLKKEIKDDVATSGRFRSVQQVAGAGHFVPQMAPKGLAEAILNALALNFDSSLSSKL